MSENKGSDLGPALALLAAVLGLILAVLCIIWIAESGSERGGSVGAHPAPAAGYAFVATSPEGRIVEIIRWKRDSSGSIEGRHEVVTVPLEQTDFADCEYEELTGSQRGDQVELDGFEGEDIVEGTITAGGTKLDLHGKNLKASKDEFAERSFDQVRDYVNKALQESGQTSETYSTVCSG